MIDGSSSHLCVWGLTLVKRAIVEWLFTFMLMIYAIVDNDKVEAFPNGKGICEECGNPVFSKCGELKVWHWSHHKNPECDNWHEPETQWHYHWKKSFGKTNSEIVIEKDGIKHRADVFTNSGVVIELQNSPIKPEVIRKREAFYGERMIWVIHGIDFRTNFKIVKRSPVKYIRNYRWQYGDPQSEMVRTVPNPIPTNEGIYEFDWKYSRSSWSGVTRPTFIDFGGKNLFWVKNGMGWSSGNGDFILKESFINKYQGNFMYFSNNHEFHFDDNDLIKEY
ncbi:hypothetical protein D1614_22815 [Maribellus luteus]|uniref:Competence protein CoiA-like family protein n=1 Tax=Maribellus luteus TaxID=2305463 RepID=A0A399STP4_9BACT|nr:competence protein CoiA family protein [Maribellus luteus]RIJ45503.1 hypothetical protein D1614_22815 [Maribellus luteus]